MLSSIYIDAQEQLLHAWSDHSSTGGGPLEGARRFSGHCTETEECEEREAFRWAVYIKIYRASAIEV